MFFTDENGKEMLALGMQSHNSSTGTFMLERAIRAARLYGANTLEVPVYWYKIEPDMDVYDMTQVKELIDRIRQTELKLIILWFGTSKNGHPSYTPEYVKLHPETYRIAIGSDGARVASLSPHCMETQERDKKAFCRLTEFIKEYDSLTKTVIALQIENEMGYANTDRDYSDLAQADYEKPVPEAIRGIKLPDDGLDYISQEEKERFSWKGCFGRHSAEAFSAWYHGRYIGSIAEEAKKIYDIPMYTNVMVMENGCEEAGFCYNGGAAVSRVLDIWKAAAPRLDLLCPDIYNQTKEDYSRICGAYQRQDNELFIPESPCMGEANALNAIRAVTDFEAIGVSCFGAESVLDNQGALLKDAESMAITMKTISALAPLLVQYHKTGQIYGIVQEEFAAAKYLKLPDFHVQVKFLNADPAPHGNGSSINLRNEENKWNLKIRGRGILVKTGEYEFYLAGAGIGVEFIKRPHPADEQAYIHLSSRQAGQLNFLSVEEGHFEKDKWITDYERNGDEANFAVYVHGGGAVRIRLNPCMGG